MSLQLALTSDSRITEWNHGDDPMVSDPSSHASLKRQGDRLWAQHADLEPVKRQNVGIVAKHHRAYCHESYCHECGLQFSRPFTYRRHMEDKHGSLPKYFCGVLGCGKSFTREDTLLRHRATQHGSGKVSCPLCRGLVRKDGLGDHQNTRLCRLNRTIGNVSEAVLIGRKDRSQFLYQIEGETQIELSSPDQNENIAQAENILISGGHAPAENAAAQNIGNLQTIRENDLDVIFQPRPCYTKIAKDHEPEIVPDSPRPVAQDDVLSMLWLDDDTSMSTLVTDLESKRDRLEASGTFARKAHPERKRSSAQFLHASSGCSRFYNMRPGSTCALCAENLGQDLEGIFQHAKSHLQCQNNPRFKCPVCNIDFAFARDLKLHSSQLEIWSFCQETPISEGHEQGDWVAEALNTARSSFINLLRNWETLQLKRYLAAIRKLLANHKAYRTASARAPSTPRSVLLSSGSAPPRSPSSIDGVDASSLDEMFGQMYFELFPDLISAAASNNIDRVNEILVGKAQFSYGAWYTTLESSLREATKRGHVAIVGRLIDHVIDVNKATNVNYINDIRRDALSYAISTDQDGVIRTLIIAMRAGDVERKCSQTWTGLHFACFVGLDDIVKRLIQRGANVEAEDNDGITPLMLAHAKNNRCCENQLLKVISKPGPQLSCPRLESFGISQITKSSGITPVSPLELAARYGHSDVVNFLLDTGCDINGRGDFGMTPLMNAAAAGQTGAFSVLMERGADVVMRDNFGNDARLWAMATHAKDIVDLVRT